MSTRSCRAILSPKEVTAKVQLGFVRVLNNQVVDRLGMKQLINYGLFTYYFTLSSLQVYKSMSMSMLSNISDF